MPIFYTTKGSLTLFMYIFGYIPDSINTIFVLVIKLLSCLNTNDFNYPIYIYNFDIIS